LNQRAALKELSVEEVVRGYLFRRQRARVGSFQVGKDNLTLSASFLTFRTQ